VALEVPASSPGPGQAPDLPRPPERTPPPKAQPPHAADASPMAIMAESPSADPGREKFTRVVSSNVSLWQRLREIWLSRELLIYLVRTEIKVKYKNSVLGLLWSMAAPAMNLLVYFVVFQLIIGTAIPNFVIYLFSGLLIWNLFQVAVQTGTGVVVNNASIVKKVSFPREILALASVGSACVFFFFQSIVFVGFLLVLWAPPAWAYLPLVPLALIACMVFAAALSVFLSAVNVYLRDMQHLIEVVLAAWFWACPIVYAFQQVIAPKLKGYTWMFYLNPVTPLVMSFQRALYGEVSPVGKGGVVVNILPDHGFTFYATLDLAVLLSSVVLLLGALIVFGRLEGNFAEEL
jgi:ABC-2 type transport system permease protein